MRVTWTPAQSRRFVEAYGTVPSKQLQAELGRSKTYLQRLANLIGIGHHRKFFTDDEKAQVKALHATHTAEQIQQIVFDGEKSLRQVYALIHRIGCPRKWPRWPVSVLARIRELHGQGLTDADIARRMPEMGKDFFGRRRAVSILRANRLKLPVNAAAVLEAHRRAQRTQFARLGLKTAGELRVWSYRRYARENGWPEDLRPRCVQVLNVLASKGAMTRLAIHLAIGMSVRRIAESQRHALSSNDPEGSYLAHLMARGLVAPLKRAVKGKGIGTSVNLYMLTGQALALLEARIAREGKGEAC